ncbi:MAG: hypothetical protein LBH71_04210 [Oscillospiraceae bacterium]|nr:hypothetical protein [Oscillospiraceae bacterium]
MFKRINIICGHYGCGKTNFSINAALNMKKDGKDVVLIDLDVVNPYFRTSDYRESLQKNGIKVISPVAAGSTLDAPFLSSAIDSSLYQKDSCVIVDVGGDDAGATSLGRFKSIIEDNYDYQCLYVVNKYRKLISEPEFAIKLMREIESASKLRMDALVNNSHLSNFTTPDVVLSAGEYAQEISRLSGLPLIATTAPKQISDKLLGRVPALYPVEIIVSLPWADKGDVLNA